MRKTFFSFAGGTEEKEETINSAKLILPKFLMVDRVKRSIQQDCCIACLPKWTCCYAVLNETVHLFEMI